MIVFTNPGASTNPGGKIVQPRVRITRLGKPAKYADSLFRSQKGPPIPLETADDFDAFFGSWATLRELVRENLAQIESTASEKEKWAASREHRYASTTECRELTTEWFARQAKNHARLALKRIDSSNADDAVGFDVVHNAMIAVEQWGRMILSIHEPAILAERAIHTERHENARIAAGAERPAPKKDQVDELLLKFVAGEGGARLERRNWRSVIAMRVGCDPSYVGRRMKALGLKK